MQDKPLPAPLRLTLATAGSREQLQGPAAAAPPLCLPSCYKRSSIRVTVLNLTFHLPLAMPHTFRCKNAQSSCMALLLPIFYPSSSYPSSLPPCLLLHTSYHSCHCPKLNVSPLPAMPHASLRRKLGSSCRACCSRSPPPPPRLKCCCSLRTSAVLTSVPCYCG